MTITREDFAHYCEIGHQLLDFETAGKLDEANKLKASLSEDDLFWINVIIMYCGTYWRQVW